MLWLVYLLELSGRAKPSGHNFRDLCGIASSSLWNAFGMVIEFRPAVVHRKQPPMPMTANRGI